MISTLNNTNCKFLRCKNVNMSKESICFTASHFYPVCMSFTLPTLHTLSHFLYICRFRFKLICIYKTKHGVQIEVCFILQHKV